MTPLDSLIDALTIRMNLPREQVELIAQSAWDLCEKTLADELAETYEADVERAAERIVEEGREIEATQKFLDEVMR